MAIQIDGSFLRDPWVWLVMVGFFLLALLAVAGWMEAEKKAQDRLRAHAICLDVPGRDYLGCRAREFKILQDARRRR